MKIEKLSENKVRITLTIQDLAEKEIDFHVFMSNSIESQSILLDMLEEAKKETGFDPEDYNLKIEALAMADTSFIFTITKVIPDCEKSKEKLKTSKKKFVIKRKSVSPNSTQAVYCFYSFEDFCNFVSFLDEGKLLEHTKEIAENISLYYYKDNYYLLMNNIKPEVFNKTKFYTGITEFGKYITNSKVFVSKLKECGNILMKNNALEMGFKYFVSRDKVCK